MLILCVQLIFSGLSSERSRFITYACIEKGNPSDKDLFVPVLNAHQENYDDLLEATVADGGYASQANISKGRDL
ncbi:hypothetical protein MNBD_GAMMA11-298 [hydrothermal vent metagenome]|uniref:Transposase IS4-like domain-containing protein n=1 Tax=hydrothermal vent metagenome TaxID=652676 RepID=A0A3B0X9R4_9ZZZZ